MGVVRIVLAVERARVHGLRIQESGGTQERSCPLPFLCFSLHPFRPELIHTLVVSAVLQAAYLGGYPCFNGARLGLWGCSSLQLLCYVYEGVMEKLSPLVFESSESAQARNGGTFGFPGFGRSFLCSTKVCFLHNKGEISNSALPLSFTRNMFVMAGFSLSCFFSSTGGSTFSFCHGFSEPLLWTYRVRIQMV